MSHERSKYYETSMFEDIANDCITLKSQYDVAFCLVGDFNARAGEMSDFVEVDEFSLKDAVLYNNNNVLNSNDKLEAQKGQSY